MTVAYLSERGYFILWDTLIPTVASGQRSPLSLCGAPWEVLRLGGISTAPRWGSQTPRRATGTSLPLPDPIPAPKDAACCFHKPGSAALATPGGVFFLKHPPPTPSGGNPRRAPPPPRSRRPPAGGAAAPRPAAGGRPAGTRREPPTRGRAGVADGDREDACPPLRGGDRGRGSQQRGTRVEKEGGKSPPTHTQLPAPGFPFFCR